jgi:hypothetical protein
MVCRGIKFAGAGRRARSSYRLAGTVGVISPLEEAVQGDSIPFSL